MRVTARTFFGTAKELGEAFGRFHYPRAVEMTTVVTDYLEMARRRKNLWWAHADMQIHLTMSLINELLFLQQLRSVEPSDDVKKEHHYTQQATRATINALTQVADGIAFRFLRYDLGLCQPFVANTTSPFALTQEGFMNVMGVATKVLDTAGPAAQILICDLNSITNEGDYILRTLEGYEVVEVKQGKSRRGSRLTRQTERMKQLSELINKGSGVLDDMHCRIQPMPARTHSIDQLAACLEEAETAGYAVRQINPYQSIACIHGNATRDQHKNDIFSDIKRRTDAIWGEDRTLDISSIQTRQWAGNLVPMSALPLRSAVVADLLMGQRIFISTISLDALLAHVAEMGWRVVDLSESDLENQPWPAPAIALLYDAEDPTRSATLPIDYLMWCGGNLIDIGSVLGPVKDVIRQDPEQSNFISSFPAETELWD